MRPFGWAAGSNSVLEGRSVAGSGLWPSLPPALSLLCPAPGDRPWGGHTGHNRAIEPGCCRRSPNLFISSLAAKRVQPPQRRGMGGVQQRHAGGVRARRDELWGRGCHRVRLRVRACAWLGQRTSAGRTAALPAGDDGVRATRAAPISPPGSSGAAPVPCRGTLPPCQPSPGARGGRTASPHPPVAQAALWSQAGGLQGTEPGDVSLVWRWRGRRGTEGMEQDEGRRGIRDGEGSGMEG